jgi:hypothetical protein
MLEDISFVRKLFHDQPQEVHGSGIGGRADLLGEHGFRFFPGFYMHLPATMKRIPFGRDTCFDDLVPTSRVLLA